MLSIEKRQRNDIGLIDGSCAWTLLCLRTIELNNWIQLGEHQLKSMCRSHYIARGCGWERN